MSRGELQKHEGDPAFFSGFARQILTLTARISRHIIGSRSGTSTLDKKNDRLKDSRHPTDVLNAQCRAS